MSSTVSSIPSSAFGLPPSVLPVVINTRPVERAAPLTEHLQAAGLAVVDMPMLTLKLLDTTAADIEIMRHWLAGDYQALVIVSPTAAAAGLKVWQALERQAQDASSDFDTDDNSINQTYSSAPSHLIAVGSATASVLQETSEGYDGHQVLQPIIANNEGMLDMPEIKALQAGDKLLVWRGLGGRRLLVNTLQERGVHIDSIAWYERTLPIDAHTNYQHWLNQFVAKYDQPNPAPSADSPSQRPIVIISSGTAFEHWSDVVERTISISATATDTTNDSLSLKLADFVYVVLGERLAHMVAAEKLSYWRVEDLAPETILAAIMQEPLQSA